MRRSRGRAVLYATACGMLLGCGSALTMIGMAGANSPGLGGGGSSGAAFTIITAIPGSLLLGGLFCTPTALILVLVMARLTRWKASFAYPLWWGAGGILFASPVIWLFGVGFMERPLEIPSVHTTLAGIAFLCGLAARWGFRAMPDDAVPDQIVPENPATTAS